MNKGNQEATCAAVHDSRPRPPPARTWRNATHRAVPRRPLAPGAFTPMAAGAGQRRLGWV